MKKYITLFICLFFISCDAIYKENGRQNLVHDNNEILIGLAKQNPEKRNITVLPYQGKYALEKFFQIQKIKELQKYTEKLLAKRIGLLQQKELELEIRYQDWNGEAKDTWYYINQSIDNNKTTWQVTYITEHLQNDFIKPANIYMLSLAEVFIRSSSDNYYQEIIYPLQKGILYYACDLGNWITQKTVVDLVNDKRTLIEESFVGFTNEKVIFPELEGYFALIYLQEKYNLLQKNQDKDITKKFIFEILFKQQKWQDMILSITGDNLAIFTRNVSLFISYHFKNNYYNSILKYNEALKNYLAENYGTAIAQFQTFILQYPDSFFALDMHFWMAMSYYELKNYDRCAEQINEIFTNNAKDFCFHFPLAKYRYAMAMYRLEKFSNAVEAFSIFVRDFPWEKDFAGSSLFFQAEMFLNNNQYERAIYHYEKFIVEYPDHHRATDTIEKVAYLYLQEEKYRRAYELFLKLTKVEDKRKIAQEAINKIVLLEQKQPSPRLTSLLHQTIKDYPGMNNSQKKAALKELGFIGKISLFWLEQIYSDSQDVISDFIRTIAYIKEPAGIRLLLPILNTTGYDQEIFKAILEIGIPINELNNIIANEMMSLPPERQENIKKQLQQMYWGASSIAIQKMPELIVNINKNEQSQIITIENMTILLDQEQVPILRELVLRGKSEQVKLKALENLIAWKSHTMLDLYKELLKNESTNIRYLALEGLISLEYKNTSEYISLLRDSDIKIRKAVLKILPKLEFSDTIGKIIELLNDEDYSIRNEAKDVLLASTYKNTNLELANALVVEVDNIRYYNFIIQILLVRTKDEKILADYFPEMNLEQRKELRDKLIASWK